MIQSKSIICNVAIFVCDLKDAMALASRNHLINLTAMVTMLCDLTRDAKAALNTSRCGADAMAVYRSS